MDFGETKKERKVPSAEATQGEGAGLFSKETMVPCE